MKDTEVTPVLATLSCRQAEAIETIVSREPDRIILGDALLVGYRAALLPPGSATHHAGVLAAELAAGDPTHPHAAWLRLVARLSRRGVAPGPKTLERLFLRAESARS